MHTNYIYILKGGCHSSNNVECCLTNECIQDALLKYSGKIVDNNTYYELKNRKKNYIIQYLDDCSHLLVVLHEKTKIMSL